MAIVNSYVSLPEGNLQDSMDMKNENVYEYGDF